MTPDEVRTRLRRQLAKTQVPAAVPCPHCGGSGEIKRRARVSTQGEVAAAIGVTRSQVVNFCNGATDLSFPVGLRLIEWLDSREDRDDG